MLKSDLQKAKNLSSMLKNIGVSSKPMSKDRVYVPMASPMPSTESLLAIIAPLIRQALAEIPQEAMPEITGEFAKKVVEAMHKLPENEKLDVGAGLRNAASFLYGGKKYGIHEMMHGGSSSSSSSQTAVNEVVAGSDMSWTLQHTPSGSIALYTNGQRLTPTVDFTIVGAAVTTVSSWSAGTLLADYVY